MLFIELIANKYGKLYNEHLIKQLIRVGMNADPTSYK